MQTLINKLRNRISTVRFSGNCSPERRNGKNIVDPNEIRLANKQKGLYADMKLYNLYPSENLQNKINYFFTPYNQYKTLKTFYMEFTEDDSMLTEEQKYLKDQVYNLANDSTLCWDKISNFILRSDNEEFKRIVSRIKNKDISEITK